MGLEFLMAFLLKIEAFCDARRADSLVVTND